jgi:hypothetical protein
MNLVNFSFWIDVVGTPVDSIRFDLFEGTEPVLSDLALTQTTVNGTQQIIATGRAWFSSDSSDKYIEVSRTGALDAVNHYSIERDNTAVLAGITYEILNASVWTVAP